MPGLVCAVGIADAGRVVRRAAEPLRRRPRHELALAATGDAGVALGYVGDRGGGGVAADGDAGVLVAVDGELVDAGVSVGGAAAARTILHRYRAAPGAWEVPEGWFAAAVWDPRRGKLALVTDRFGQRPLYATRLHGGLVVASELKALVAAGLRPELDLQAWAELLAYEYPLAGSVPLAGVRLVPQASTLVLDPGGGEELEERWRYRSEPEPDGDERELVEALGVLLEPAVRRRLGRDTGLGLSAGLDSRCLAAVAAASVPPPLAATYGAESSQDLVGGTELARRAGLPHRRLPLPPGYIARGAAATVWLGEGHVRCFHAHHLALPPLREQGLRSLLMGFAGDIVMRGVRLAPPASEGAFADHLHRELAGCVPDRLLDVVLTPEFAASVRGRAREALGDQLAREDGVDNVARWRQFGFRHNRRRMLWGSELFRDDLLPRDPFADRDLVDFCRLMPERLRVGGVLQRAYVSRFPALATVSSPKDGLPPRLRGRRRVAAAVAVRARTRARRAADSVLGPAWRPTRTGLGDYATDLRRAGSELLGILLEPRTVARGQLREEGVRRLVDETLAGRARHTRALGMLLTLELFQRQFLEGEHPRG